MMWLAMCLGVPAKIVSIDKDTMIGIGDFGGVKRRIDLILVPDIKVGEYVIVHAGAAIGKIDKEEAEKTLSLWMEIMGLMREESVR